jgi:hypothetical protein
VAGLSETSQNHTNPTSAQPRRRTGDARFPFFRVRQLERIIIYRHGERLPDDDDGRDLLRVVAHHLAQIGPGRIRPWALQWMPTITAAELADLIDQAGAGWRWGADELAHEIGLDDATRKRLRITTIGAIDCSKIQRVRRRKRKAKAAARARRAKAGAKPHAKSAAETQPWIAEGISRRTWYRRRAKVGTDGTNSNAADLSSYMRSEISEKSISCHPRPKGGDSDRRSRSLPSSSRTTGSGDAHGAKASTIIAKPLPSPNPAHTRAIGRAPEALDRGRDQPRDLLPATTRKAPVDHHRHDGADDDVSPGWLERLGVTLTGPISGRW